MIETEIYNDIEIYKSISLNFIPNLANSTLFLNVHDTVIIAMVAIPNIMIKEYNTRNDLNWNFRSCADFDVTPMTGMTPKHCAKANIQPTAS
jgi:hypothetical protein